MKPRWKHDCEGCQWLGRWDRWDLYVCVADRTRSGKVSEDVRRLDTVFIARFGDRRGAYASFEEITLRRRIAGCKDPDWTMNMMAGMIAMDRWMRQLERNGERCSR